MARVLIFEMVLTLIVKDGMMVGVRKDCHQAPAPARTGLSGGFSFVCLDGMAIWEDGAEHADRY